MKKWRAESWKKCTRERAKGLGGRKEWNACWQRGVESEK